MKIAPRILILWSALFLLAGSGAAQIRDVGALGSVELTKALNKKAEVTIGEELRFNEQVSNLNRSKTWIEMDYVLLKRLLSANLEYNLLYYDKNNIYETRHRVALGVTLQERRLPVRLKLRSKVQSTWRDESRGDYSYNPRIMWRNKITVDHNFKSVSLRPYVSGEIYTPLNGKKTMYLTDVRAAAGVKYRTSKVSTLDFFVRYDQEIQQKNPITIFYGGIGWNYSL